MDIISKKSELSKSFWLFFYINGIGDEWIEYDLPIPTFHKHVNKGYQIAWAIDGYFGTPKGQEFLNDVLARFLISFKSENIERLSYRPPLDDKTAKIYAKVYKLREFSKQLKSLPVKRYIPKRADSFEDFTFWAIKLYAEDLIRQSGLIVYERLESWALSQFESKERSTIRAKCRSVWRWYEERDFQLSRKYENKEQYRRETMASRSEHIIKLNKERGEANKRAVINLMTGLFAGDYRKKTGSWNVSKIAKQLKMSRNTVAKIIKEIQQKDSVNSSD